MKKTIMSAEKKRAWDEVLFWARRLTSCQADNHPEWKMNYVKAKRKLTEIKEREVI